MPDRTLATVSATETPALWNASPWLTRWMLWRKFHDGMNVSAPPNARMDWGLKMQPLIITQAATDLKMETRANADDTYLRRGVLGCTRDGEIIFPDLGPAALETKCVFEYGDWMQKWGGGEFVPRHYEIQLQQQMYVGDGTAPYKRGVLAAWIAGEVHYFHRDPIPELWAEMETEAAKFLASVRDGDEPEPFGHPMEIPFLSAIERQPGKSLVLADDELARLAQAYAEAGDVASETAKRREEIKAKLMAAAGDAVTLKLPGDVTVEFKQQSRAGFEVKPTTFTVMKVRV